MTAEKTNLQKLEALLNSATNERQRKMYLALINKARASIAPPATPEEEKTTKSSTTKKTKLAASTASKKKKVPDKTAETPQPQARAFQDEKQLTSKEKAVSTKDSKEKSPTTEVTEAVKYKKVTEETPSKINAPDIVNQKEATTNSTSVIETKSNKNIKQDKEQEKKKEKAETKTQSQTQSQTKSQTKKQPTNRVIFQGTGIIKGTPYIKADQLFVKIDEQQYELQKVFGYQHKQALGLKLELEKNGEREMLLRVYPNLTHYPDSRPTIQRFSLVHYYLNEEEYSNLQQEFIFRGIWQSVDHYPTPVITIYRNFDRIEAFRKLKPLAKKYFAKPQDIPVIWDAPVEPFKYQHNQEKSEEETNIESSVSPQMPCYFVQVKAIFKDGQYIVTEMLKKPTLKIPKFIIPWSRKYQCQYIVSASKKAYKSQSKSKSKPKSKPINDTPKEE